ncbi:MAG TPA: GNAT family N-acetyltransferase [Actinopolymorphaceae bacterium]|nr:GNAT family N-acetyltransferase [Actinopolymorphaceae bacterium]
MNETPSNVGLQMVRDDLADFPLYELPADYRFRAYREGDDLIWTKLHVAAEPYIEVTPALFTREFAASQDVLPDRMFIVETLAGEPAASITAWWERARYNPMERGRIHWVVVHPDHQRRGISKPMMTRAMQRLARSHSNAMLGTSSGRLWALKVYLDFGFHPDPVEMETKPEVAAAWRGVQERLNHPLLAKKLR